jgi:hypothetical protein
MSQVNIDNTDRNKLGDTALILVIAGWIAGFTTFYPPLAIIGSVLCPLGLILGLIALWREPRRSASRAVGMGILGQLLFVGTIWNEILLYIQSQQ